MHGQVNRFAKHQITELNFAVLYHPDLEVDLTKAEDRVSKIIADNGGKITATDNWGKRKLAYNIKGNGTPLWADQTIDRSLLPDLQLLTAKPIIYLFNMDEDGLGDAAKQSELKNLVAPAQALFVCAKLESELKDLDAADAQELLESYGQTESGLLQLIHAAYETLGLQSYLTAGEKEVRAWTIAKGSTAPQAAGVIHGDFERGFIAAEVVDCDDLLTAGSQGAAKAAGKVRTEGKTYVMAPNDVVEFRFNV